MTEPYFIAPTRFVEVDGDRFAGRRWGNASTRQPPLFLVWRHGPPGALMRDGLAAG